MSNLLTVGALVNVDNVDDPIRCGAVFRQWLRAATTLLYPEMWERLTGGDPKLASGLVVTARKDGAIEWRGTFSANKWASVWETLDSHPEAVTVNATDEETGDSIDLRVGFWPEIGARLRTNVTSAEGNDVHSRWMTFLVRALEDVSPVFGAAGERGNDGLYTDLDQALLRDYEDSIMEGRAFLRGYQWITVLPAELAGRVGMDRLHHAGVERVESLRGGGVALQTTESPSGFDSAAMDRLFRLLAPVLPPGQPKPDPFQQLSVVFEDASEADQ